MRTLVSTGLLCVWACCNNGAKVGPSFSLGCKAKGILSPSWDHVKIVHAKSPFWRGNTFGVSDLLPVYYALQTTMSL